MDKPNKWLQDTAVTHPDIANQLHEVADYIDGLRSKYETATKRLIQISHVAADSAETVCRMWPKDTSVSNTPQETGE